MQFGFASAFVATYLALPIFAVRNIYGCEVIFYPVSEGPNGPSAQRKYIRLSGTAHFPHGERIVSAQVNHGCRIIEEMNTPTGYTFYASARIGPGIPTPENVDNWIAVMNAQSPGKSYYFS